MMKDKTVSVYHKTIWQLYRMFSSQYSSTLLHITCLLDRAVLTLIKAGRQHLLTVGDVSIFVSGASGGVCIFSVNCTHTSMVQAEGIVLPMEKQEESGQLQQYLTSCRWSLIMPDDLSIWSLCTHDCSIRRHRGRSRKSFLFLVAKDGTRRWHFQNV